MDEELFVMPLEEGEMVETTTHIDVEVPENILIEMEEATATFSGDIMRHSDLPDRNQPNQHMIQSIEGLVDILKTISHMKYADKDGREHAAKSIYSAYGGFAEFRPWYGEKKDVGYFVELKLDESNNLCVDVCNGEESEVYGVTVASSGFCGYQYDKYDMLGVLDDTTDDFNRNKNIEKYAQVCLIGNIKVRVSSEEEWARIKPGYYVVPDDYGCAVLSLDDKKNLNYAGYKVTSKGTTNEGFSGNTWYYVSISLTPQNDGISRVIKTLNDAQNGIGILQDKIDNIEEVNTQVSEGFKEVLKDVEGVKQQVANQNEVIETTLVEANRISSEAKTTIEAVRSQYSQALGYAQDAKEGIAEAQETLSTLQEMMKPLAEWEGEDGASKVLGFVEQVNKDSAMLASMTEAFGPDGSDVTAIMQKIDSNGGAIELMVSHTDKYTLGEFSPTNGFSRVETDILNPGHIYVPTVSHTETSPIYHVKENLRANVQYEIVLKENKDNIVATYYFSVSKENKGALIQYNLSNQKLIINDVTYDYSSNAPEGDIVTLELTPEYTHVFQAHGEGVECISYMWAYNNDASVYEWKSDRTVLVESSAPTGKAEGDLWWYKMATENDEIYTPNFLYYWNASKKIWTPVASESTNASSRIIGVIRQTAGELTSTYANALGDISEIKQTATEVSSIVQGFEDNLSQINQTAEKIALGTYDPELGATSLELLLGGLQSTSNYNGHICIQSAKGDAPSFNGAKYDQVPLWDGSKFYYDSNMEPSATGVYYVDPDDSTRYYELVEGGYRVYAIDKTAMAAFKTLTNDAISGIESWTQFQAGMSETKTAITQTSSEDGAEILSMVFGEYRQLEEINLEPTEEDLSILSDKRYQFPPKWGDVNIRDDDGNIIIEKGFTFDGMSEADKDNNKIYCLSTIEGYDYSYYYKLLLGASSQVVGYEKYKMQASNYSSILQKTNEDGSTAGLVIGGTDIDASGFIIESLNGNTSATINAHKIGIDGTVIFTDKQGNGSTTISGDYIRTGVLQSANYNGPVTYRKYGIKVSDDGTSIVEGINTDYIYVASAREGKMYELLSYSSNPIYYWHQIKDAKTSVNIGDSLTQLEDEANFTAENSGFIVSTSDFDLMQNNLAIEGTKFDLNVGTIFSKNFTLDREGDLTITGKITATSGYIGNETNGFTIGREDLKYCHEIKGVLYPNNYYFNCNNTFYAFSIEDTLYDAKQIILNCTNSTIEIGEESVEFWKPESEPDDAILLSAQDISTYYLSYNGQTTLGGYAQNKGKDGVYIGPKGIGLGHGKFAVTSKGTIQTRGAIEMYQDDADARTPIFSVDEEDGLKLDGNITLTGNIVLGGSITWSATNNPIKVLYARTGDTTPSHEWLKNDGSGEYYPENYNKDFANGWHRKYNKEYDCYASYSYDGGNTWNDPIRIKGEDGNPGEGGSGDLNTQGIYDYLTNYGDTQGIFPFYIADDLADAGDSKLFINAEYINSGVLQGVEVRSAQLGDVEYEDDDGKSKNREKHIVRIKEGLISWYAGADEVSYGKGEEYTDINDYLEKTRPKMKIGYGTSDDAYAPFILFGQGATDDPVEGGGMLGQPLYGGQGFIFKDSNSFNINFIDSWGYVRGIHFYDVGSAAKNNSYIGFSRGTDVNFGSESVVDFSLCADVQFPEHVIVARFG